MNRKDQVFRQLRREIQAARLKCTLDEQLGRETSPQVRALASMDLPLIRGNTDVVGRVVLSDPAALHGGVGPVMLELHADGTTTWRPIYQSKKGRKFVHKDGPPKTPKEG
jgi:hypothetical protein